MLNQLLQAKGAAVAPALTPDQGCSLLCETQDGQVKKTTALMFPRSLSGGERLTFQGGRKSFAAIMALDPEIRELRWGFCWFLRISIPIIPPTPFKGRSLQGELKVLLGSVLHPSPGLQ